jgi:sugar phosphate isomerase/epimerase
MAMKLAFSTNAYKRHTLAEAIASIASIGYAGVEIMADRPHAWPADMPPQRVDELSDQLAVVGLAVSNVNAFTMFAVGDTYHPSWIEAAPAQRRQRIEHTRGAIRLAAGLGARTVSIEPGGPLEGVDRPSAPARFHDGIEQLLGDADSVGVTLCIEPEPGLMIETGQEYLEFVMDFATPLVKMNLDLGHMFCVKEDPAAVIARLAGEYAHVHLEDIAASRVHQHLVPGAGAMDFEAIFRALEKAGYDGWITVELYPYESTAESAGRRAMEFLKRFRF